ncbi:Thioredoxin domain-containing protein 5 like [Pseudolycoriella hygida]|uniref:Thioredoxin domain-containing protein 5 like n=1 Tax=Pseudolycoriella hygida TaxID=35572 RepID=A0A9Q0S117_9DIPT|nr:Thioredoxin domain-containing protein 5 like [Pseudolycoriella hygida]
MWSSVTIFLSICVSIVISDDYKKPGTFAVPLSQDNFAEETANFHYMVLYYSTECEVSQKFLPKYERLAEQFNNENGLKFGTVDCITHNDLCAANGAKALEIILYKKEEGKAKFRGVRNVDGVTKFLVKHLGEVILNNVVDIPEKLEAINELTDETFVDHVGLGQHFVKFYAPWCGHCQRLAPTWDELASALEYDETVSISKIDCTLYRPICLQYEVKGYPTLLWIVDGKRMEKYSGQRSLDDLKEYVEKTAGILVKRSVEPEIQSQIKVEEAVLQLTTQSFDHAVEKGVTFVKFFAPWCGHCKRMAKTWDELAAKFIGTGGVKIAKVDCTLAESKELCTDQDVNGFPTLYIYKNGEKISEYGGNRSLEDLFEFVNRHISSSRDEL